MQIHIHLGTNLEYFKLLNEGYLLSQGKKDKEIANFIMENFPGELAENISPQYETNFVALREIKRKFSPEVFNKISGLYYGSDNCEYLTPTLNEIKEAINLFKEFNQKYPPHAVRSFTLVTPYVGNKMFKRLDEVLDYLNNLKIKNPIEVVINDFGVLRLVTKKYNNLKPIFGRVIHKLLKTPLVDTYGYEAHPAGESIKNKSEQEKLVLRDEIVKWQMKFYNSAEVSLVDYRDFLEKFGINRVALDYMQSRENLYDNSRFGNIGIDLYYPWALVFTGRLCDTSAIENPARGNFAINEVCPRTCFRYDIFYKIKTKDYKLIQRGNAGYRSEINLDFLKEEFTKNDDNRLVFAPFVSV